MKALALSTLAAMSMAGAAHAGAITLGGPLALNCYEAAEARETSEEAIRACDRALAEEPLTLRNRAATLVNRGILHMVGKSYVEAGLNFDAAAALDPSLADSWLNKGFLELRQGNGSAALPLIERAMTLRASREALAYYARGIAHEQTGNLQAAYADLQKARELEPDWDLPARELARYRLRGG